MTILILTLFILLLCYHLRKAWKISDQLINTSRSLLQTCESYNDLMDSRWQLIKDQQELIDKLMKELSAATDELTTLKTMMQ